MSDIKKNAHNNEYHDTHDDIERGFVSINKNDLKSAYECFQKLKSYAKNLKEILEGGK